MKIFLLDKIARNIGMLIYAQENNRWTFLEEKRVYSVIFYAKKCEKALTFGDKRNKLNERAKKGNVLLMHKKG